jgi:DNA modification methylase
MSINKLILGDNLEILKSIESDTIDLIYPLTRRFSATGTTKLSGETQGRMYE